MNVSRNSEASATQSGQSLSGFPVPIPFNNLHCVAPFRSWNLVMISFMRAREVFRSLDIRNTTSAKTAEATRASKGLSTFRVHKFTLKRRDFQILRMGPGKASEHGNGPFGGCALGRVNRKACSKTGYDK